MQWTPFELVTLAALLRHVMGFDGLSSEDRRSALAEASRELGLLAGDAQLIEDTRAGYRDAARVVHEITSGLDEWIARAAREVSSDSLRPRAAQVVGDDKRVAMLRAVEILARRGGLARPERLFLGWLATFWGVPSVVGDYDLEG